MNLSRIKSTIVARRIALLAVAGGALVMIGALLVAYAEHRQYGERVRALAVSEVSDVRAQLEGALVNRLVLPDALAALTVANDGAVGADFEGFTRGLAASHRSYSGLSGDDPAVRSLQLAPDAVVTYVYPPEGNEAAIGHDLLADPARGPAVKRAIEERRFVLAGPFELLQGGTGLVGRTPIYLGEDEFWGFATVVLNFDAIAAEAGLDGATRNELVVSLRGRDGLGAQGEVFLGDGAVFDRDPVILDVLVPNGTWQIAAEPVDGWPRFPLRAVTIIILTIGSLLAIAVTHAILRWERAHREVTRVSDNLTRLIDSTTSPIVAVDPQGKIVEWNHAMTTLTGVSKESATSSDIGAHWLSMSADAKEAEEIVRAVEVVRSGEQTSTEVVAEFRDPARTVEFTVTARTELDGQLGSVLLGHDVTARREAERMRVENAALARSANLKDEFLAGMSHELRTPLNAIIGLGTVLGRGTFGALNDKQISYVTQIESSGQHLLGLINDVLDLAKLDATMMELEIETFDVADVIRESLDLVAPLAAKRGVTITTHPSGDGHIVVADRRRLRQVLVNLMSNSVKFTDRGGRVGVDVDATGTDLGISVWDTGIGIEHSDFHLLFEPFLQVDGSLARGQEGSGLGLAIASRLVGLHGGEILVESSPGNGSRFTVRLPIRDHDFDEAWAPTAAQLTE